MTSDPIADMLTRIRNAIKARHPKVDVPASKLKTEIARILKEEGYILNYKMAEEGAHKAIRVYLKYTAANAAGDLEDRARVAPGLPRVRRAARRFRGCSGGLGINILTTPQGVMTGRDARKEGVGGELLCQVW